VFHPRIGQEVLIQFEHGDPDRPIIIGMAHNSSNMPTYVPYDQPTRSGIKTRSSELGSSDEANELYFEDKKGSETVYMHAQKDHTCVIENNDSTTVGQGDHNINVAAR
jgi:type VI secretion system secreted protein VgrG